MTEKEKKQQPTNTEKYLQQLMKVKYVYNYYDIISQGYSKDTLFLCKADGA